MINSIILQKIHPFCDGHGRTCKILFANDRGVVTGRAGGHGSLTLISEPKKVQQFQFQTSGVFLFTGVQEIYGPEISQFLPCMLQFLDNLRWHFTFSSYIGEIDHFRLTFSKGPILSPGHSEMFLIMDHPTEDLNEQEFKR